tara:strand:+ start:36 stop:641 length:606 start_codon:yes stop_codon:yes gene_type:complete
MSKWKCSICGYVHEGDIPPGECPHCESIAEVFYNESTKKGYVAGPVQLVKEVKKPSKKKAPKKKIKKLVDDKELERAWGYYKHADSITAGKINFFLVAESILIVSFLALFKYASSETWLLLSITILGLVYTSVWFVVNLKITWKANCLKESIRIYDPIYNYYEMGSNNWLNKISFHYWLPIPTICFWIFLISYIFILDKIF